MQTIVLHLIHQLNSYRTDILVQLAYSGVGIKFHSGQRKKKWDPFGGRYSVALMKPYKLPPYAEVRICFKMKIENSIF